MSTEFENLVKQVRDLYMRYGVKSITMDDVASHLCISKKTLYQHVKNKDELVEKVIDLEIEDQVKDMECVNTPSINAIEKLLLVSKIVSHKLKNTSHSTEYDLNKYYPHHYQRLLKARRERMYKSIVNNIEIGKQENLYRDDLDGDIIGKLQVSRMEGMLNNEIFTIEEFTSPKFFLEVFVYHIRGIANQKGIDFLEQKLKDFDINDLTHIYEQ
ncbi:MAG: TetR/AcrR family transcriptional regulator [Bacteroidales bacterium]|nr:TetR/AcrR family transcriptional regulator [Bacteroidales bacterium]MDD4385300.1 TetR/AcrR family transcriptional regulator [Bacteroidales bacterium]MDY0199326.1 TetR/AcrR family transcriptional regulator [Tenuifilaceae bacterium]